MFYWLTNETKETNRTNKTVLFFSVPLVFCALFAIPKTDIENKDCPPNPRRTAVSAVQGGYPETLFCCGRLQVPRAALARSKPPHSRHSYASGAFDLSALPEKFSLALTTKIFSVSLPGDSPLWTGGTPILMCWKGQCLFLWADK